jgi:hypothetical protein
MMDKETTETNETPVTLGDIPVEQPEGSTESVEGAAPADPTSDDVDPAPKPDDPKTISMPTAAVAKLKQQAAQKAEAKFLARLKALGYSSIEELEEAKKEEGNRPARRSRDKKRPSKGRPRRPERTQTTSTTEDISMSGEAANNPTPAESPRKITRLEKENARLLEEKKRLNRARAQEEKRRKHAEREREAMHAENELKLAAVRAGVQDVDYAIHLLRQNLQGKSKEELEEFDEHKYFKAELRKSHPYLYGTTEQPADTSTDTPEDKQSAGAPPTPAGSNPTVRNDGAHAPKPVEEMTQKEYKALLKQHGLNDPAAGMPA